MLTTKSGQKIEIVQDGDGPCQVEVVFADKIVATFLLNKTDRKTAELFADFLQQQVGTVLTTEFAEDLFPHLKMP